MSLVLLLLVTTDVCFVDNFGIYLVINVYLPSKELAIGPGALKPQKHWELDVEKRAREDG